MLHRRNKLVQGWGVNDADYNVVSIIDGKQVQCRYYSTWVGMINRCTNRDFQTKKPTYIGYQVSPQWRYFKDFKKWMETQDWEGKHLDKDLLQTRDKVYSPETCIFIDSPLNNFLTDRRLHRGVYPLGVCWSKAAKKYVSQCRKGDGSRTYLGLFTCPNEAHEAWRLCKHEIACQYADQQTDPRIAHALRTRYSYENWYKNKECD